MARGGNAYHYHLALPLQEERVPNPVLRELEPEGQRKQDVCP